jgi:short-subunit dehydrogenase
MAKALVTGASTGIGLEFIYQLAAKGYDVILVSRNKNKLDEIASDVAKKYSVKAEVLVADLGTDQGIKQTCDFISQNDIEFVVNNAGLGIKVGLPEEITRTMALLGDSVWTYHTNGDRQEFYKVYEHVIAEMQKQKYEIS